MISDRMTFDIMLHEYVVLNKSMRKIAEEFNVSYSSINLLLKEYKLPVKKVQDYPLIRQHNNIKKPKIIDPIKEQKKLLKKEAIEKLIKYDFLYHHYVELDKTIRQISNELFCDWTTVKNYIIQHKIKLKSRSELSKGCKNPMYGVKRYDIRGENNYNWKGGLYSLRERIRATKRMIEWRRQVFERDNYTCQICGDNKGGNLNADHIKPLALLIKEYDMKTIDDAYDCRILWDINNGRTLCIECHKKTETWGHYTTKMARNTS